MGRSQMTALLAVALLATGAMGFSPRLAPVRSRTLMAAEKSHHRDSSSSDRRSAIGSMATLLTSVAVAAPAMAYDEYLREPTKDFLDSEERAQAYRKKQAVLKKKFAIYIDELNASINDDEMEDALKKMTKLVLEQQDLPSGYTKESFMRIAGLKKKAMLQKGLWGTPVDVAYKTLVMKITLVQSPNRMEAVY